MSILILGGDGYLGSLRLHLDTASIAVTYVLKGTPRKHKLSMIDRALQE